MHRSKYRAVKTTVDGKTFASKKEAARYQELKMLEKAGKINGLETQVRYTLSPKDELGRSVMYVADFGYYEKNHAKAWVWIVEDVKGFKTAVYKLKRRMIFSVFGILIRET